MVSTIFSHLPLVIAVVGLMASMAISAWLWNRADRQLEDALAERGHLLAENISAAMDTVTDQLIAVGGLYEASEEVTQSEFSRFVSSFGVAPGVSGIAHAQVVAIEELDRFVSDIRETIPGYEVFEFDRDGQPRPVDRRSRYVPIGWLERSRDDFEAPYGFDLSSEPFLSEALDEAWVSHDAAATSFVQLAFDEDQDWFLIVWPITDTLGGAEAFTIALIDLSDFLEAQIPSSLSQLVDWEVTDLATGSGVLEPDVTGSWTTELDVVGRRWELTVTPAGTVDATPDHTSAMVVLLAGVTASLLAANGLHQYRQKSETNKELARLQELAAAKDQFLASVSHELRTPLTGVLGFAELLVDGAEKLPDDEKKTMIASIADDAGDLAAIIDDLLVAARSELDLVTVTRQKIKVRPLVDRVLDGPGGVTSRTVTVRRDSHADLEVFGDPARVRQILRNLISNAHRYGGDQIHLSLTAVEGFGHIRVEDDGNGLLPENWDRIFEPYVRLHQAAGQPATLGIGLSVSRHLARLMGGDLTYQHRDGWSSFDLSLPLEPASENDKETLKQAVSTG